MESGAKVPQNLEGEQKGLNDYTISLISVWSFPNIDFGEPKFLEIIAIKSVLFEIFRLVWG